MERLELDAEELCFLARLLGNHVISDKAEGVTKADNLYRKVVAIVGTRPEELGPLASVTNSPFYPGRAMVKWSV